jgi:hypothetical protein
MWFYPHDAYLGAPKFVCMRKTLLIILFAGTAFSGNAQRKTEEFGFGNFDKNIVKLNLFALPLKNFSLQYERGLNKDISVSLGASFMPKTSIPFKKSILNAMETDGNDTTDAGRDFMDNARISSWAITPEFRYYFGKKPLNGFYVAPYVRIGGYSVDWAYLYEKDNGDKKPVDLKGRSTSFSAGLLLGAQWHLANRIVLDWWILGPQWSSHNISMEAVGDFSDLTPSEKADLEETIEKIGFSGNKFEATVTNSSVKAENKIGLPGLRTGLCIGFCF